MALADPTGLLLTGIRDHPEVAALTDRVRCPDPVGRQVAPDGTVLDEGDARGPGKWVRFVVLRELVPEFLPHAPVQGRRYVAQCYGQGGNPAQDAIALRGAVFTAVHAAGRRRSGGGVVIFDSLVVGGGGPIDDPDTGQPHADLVIEVGASTALIA